MTTTERPMRLVLLDVAQDFEESAHYCRLEALKAAKAGEYNEARRYEVEATIYANCVKVVRNKMAELDGDAPQYVAIDPDDRR